MPDKSINNGGQIEDCVNLGRICSFDCCNQDAPDDVARPESSLLLYPGELEAVVADRRKHIVVTLNDFNGGKLGYCDPIILDRFTCDLETNFKSLDCQSYPFAPAFSNGELILLVDRRRCPLSLASLMSHHRSILDKWKMVAQGNPEVRRWIEMLSLRGYEEFNP